MSTTHKDSKLDSIWYTRCAGGGRGGVPTAFGIAHHLGYLQEEFKNDGLKLLSLQEDAGPELRHNHYDHQLPNLIREGGNLFSIPAKAQGANTRLIGLTWIDEAQSILVRPDSDIRTPAQLKGRRLGLPVYRSADIAENRRGRTITRLSSLHGFKGALASANLTLDDVTLVEVGEPNADTHPDVKLNFGGWWQSLEALASGKVDAIYVKGAAAQDGARHHGLRVGIDLDKLPSKRFRVNNGTPRPVTVHQDFLDNHYDLLVRFLHQTLRAADWAKTNLKGVHQFLQAETAASADGVAAAYRDGFHLSLAPDLSDERVELFRQQKTFLLNHQILDRDFDFDQWIDRRPLEDAVKRLQGDLRAAA
ncbi:2'-hydroxybiphenyl-2-sulfinate desulfinase [Panacagrimonas perspica]|uniref:2'-hydroxybiphenyl-2-sulfinate desulfinase n=1 Tax=Panacagrimonas perspica TaxID=381431 RepID=A0A4R7PCG2_9GAMM|nr:ABC transporter substrate-binding protein [Panacagrimonas perspica]TDU31708.1 2'-hydroxybiphenyl-2-sulfinate desulfinase [Panacagrimonas perspica]THD03077.1 monooxygenase [Panacagrimonas perspica]